MKKIKLLTFFSESHKDMYNNHFLLSFNNHLSESFTLIPNTIEQYTKDGNYYDKGFNRAMKEKIKIIISNIDTFDENLMVFADADIQFFGDFSNYIKNDIGDYDIMFQDDILCLCAGFMVFKQTEDVKKFFINVYNITHNFEHDQVAINHLINTDQHNLKVKKLDRETFFTIGSATKAKQWNGETNLEIPKNILVHHANWTVGNDNKIKLLNYIRDEITTLRV